MPAPERRQQACNQDDCNLADLHAVVGDLQTLNSPIRLPPITSSSQVTAPSSGSTRRPDVPAKGG
jgi:hypothetical protein